jgi:hypothetical protein
MFIVNNKYKLIVYDKCKHQITSLQKYELLLYTNLSLKIVNFFSQSILNNNQLVMCHNCLQLYNSTDNFKLINIISNITIDYDTNNLPNFYDTITYFTFEIMNHTISSDNIVNLYNEMNITMNRNDLCNSLFSFNFDKLIINNEPHKVDNNKEFMTFIKSITNVKT